MHSPPDLPLFYGGDDFIVEVAFHEPDLRSLPPESLTQSIWEQGRFSRRALFTTDGQEIRVLDRGAPNRDSGPDFLDATVSIGDVRFTGDVEIHNASGQWFDHGHDRDERYNSVILHVTLHPDMWTGRLTRADGTVIPELVLYPLLEASLRSLLFDHLREERRSIPCASAWSAVPESVITGTIRSLGRERLKQVSGARIRPLTEGEIEQELYYRTMVALGYAKNSEPMLDVARRLPLRLARSIDRGDLEAAFLGVAGLIPEPSDLLKADRDTADYAISLRDAYERLRHVHDLVALPKSRWQFFRLRPSNFPTVRLAQAAALVAPGGWLSGDPVSVLKRAVAEAEPVRALRNALGVSLGEFWSRHVRLDRSARSGCVEIGRDRIDQIILNAVIPPMMNIARFGQDRSLPERLIDIASALPAESTEITRLYQALGTTARDALDTQGMSHLYRTHCSRVRCLSCPIGQRILKPDTIRRDRSHRTTND
jgi:hypothetical protein